MSRSDLEPESANESSPKIIKRPIVQVATEKNPDMEIDAVIK